MKTFRAKEDDKNQKWMIVNAENKVLGRLACEIAKILMGKHKVVYSPDVDCGDFVIVMNATKIVVTGKKRESKVYYRHTGYVGGLKTETYLHRLEKKPDTIIMSAVKGMLPKNRLGRDMLKRLRVYAGSEHPHAAQQPEVINV